MDNNRTDYSVIQKKAKTKKIHAVNIIRAVIQIISFIIMPGLFISIFSSLGAIYTSIIQGTFNISEQSWHIVLVSAVFIITFIWGRFFCGFICSFGAMQDLLWFGGKHMPKKIKVSQKADRILKLLKYAVLLFIVVGIWTFSATGTTLWSPWTIFGMYATFKGFPSAEYLLSIGGALMLVIIIGSLFIERFFCKYLCPLGALFSPVSKFRIFRIKKPSTSCGNCKLCSGKCTMSVPMSKYDSINDGECINCMRCTTVCHRDNIKADVIPAVSGTVAATALMGVYFVGNISPDFQANNSLLTSQISDTESTGKFKDGTYNGTGSGFRGDISLTVTVSGGNITDITVNESRDDNEFFSKAQSKIIPSIISSQSINVDTVSGATFSSRGIIEAVKNALGNQIMQYEISQPSVSENSTSNNFTKKNKKKNNTDFEENSLNDSSQESSEESKEESIFEQPSEQEESKNSEIFKENDESSYRIIEESEEEVIPVQEESENNTSTLSDGVYTGTGTGYRGATNVSVTVSGGRIVDITINSYQDDGQFFNRASGSIISSVIESQSTNVDTVSGATFSSNGLIEAISNALGIEFINPNSTISRKHGR